MAAQEEGHVAIQVAGNGSIDAQWSAQLLKRWMAHHGLKVKTSTNKAKLQDEEVTLRVHTFFRNLVRIRTAYLPEKLELDFYDHAPFLRRMSGGDTVGQKGAQSTFVEKNGDRRTRFTVVVPGSSDRTQLHPSILFKAPNPGLLRDFEKIHIAAGKKIFVQYNSTPAYDQESTLKLFEHQYSTPRLEEFTSGLPRILVFDQFAGQIGEKCINAAVKYRRIPLVIYGGLTPLLQPADSFQIKQMKALYRPYEQQRLLAHQKHHPREIPQMSRSDVVRAVGQAWTELSSKEGYAAQMQRTLLKAGLTSNLDGSDDAALSTAVRTILMKEACVWEGRQCSFFIWRENYVQNAPKGGPKPTMRSAISLIENPFNRADRERMIAQFLASGEDVEVEGRPEPKQHDDSTLSLAVYGSQDKAEGRPEPQKEDPAAALAAQEEDKAPAGEAPGDADENGGDRAAHGAEPPLDKGFVHEKYAVRMKKVDMEATLAPQETDGGHLAAEQVVGIISRLPDTKPEFRRETELGAIEAIAGSIRTPSLVAALREACRRERKYAGATNREECSRLASRASASVAEAELKEKNEEERNRA